MPRKPTINLQVPADFDLRRDVCSYGYFLLAPNYWDPHSGTLWRVFSLSSGPLLAHIAQPKGAGEKLRVTLSGTLAAKVRTQFIQQIARMLRLDESTQQVRAFHRLDPRFKKAGRARLFRSPTLFEDIIKTVTSCNVQWPGTISMNKRLCEVVGNRISVTLLGTKAPTAHAFPTPQQLAKVRPATLRARCRVGYRDQRLVELARLFLRSPTRGGIDQVAMEDPATTDDALFKTLVALPGIGPYAAANIMQLLGRYARVPLDTESVRHGKSILGYTGTSAQVMKQVHMHFEQFKEQAFRSYWFEMWQHYESKHGPAWTWERDTTGRLFTAAHLK